MKKSIIILYFPKKSEKIKKLPCEKHGSKGTVIADAVTVPCVIDFN